MKNLFMNSFIASSIKYSVLCYNPVCLAASAFYLSRKYLKIFLDLYLMSLSFSDNNFYFAQFIGFLFFSPAYDTFFNEWRNIASIFQYQLLFKFKQFSSYFLYIRKSIITKYK